MTGGGGAVAGRGLLVDWGGVLTTSMFAAFEAFCVREGLPPDTVTRLLRADPTGRDLLVGLELGTLPEADFNRRFAALLDVDPTALVDRLTADARPDTAMLAAVAAARRHGARTGLISNSWGASRYPLDLLRELFDGVVISGRVGVRKPSPRIYQLGADSIGLPARQCVFVDDLGANLKPARQLGMATVLHRAAATSIPELERLLGVTLVAAGGPRAPGATVARPAAAGDGTALAGGTGRAVPVRDHGQGPGSGGGH